jgi:hypothetical protein
MRNFRSVICSGLVAGSLIASTGFAADRDFMDELKDQFERGRDRVERDRDRDRYDRDRDRDRDRYDRDRRDRRGREDRISGTVTYVDKKRQAFSVRERDNEVVTVLVPSDLPSRDRERFANLQKGDNVRIEGRFEARDKFTLEEFR